MTEAIRTRGHDVEHAKMYVDNTVCWRRMCKPERRPVPLGCDVTTHEPAFILFFFFFLRGVTLSRFKHESKRNL